VLHFSHDIGIRVKAGYGMTATLKVRRSNIYDKFADEIEALFIVFFILFSSSLPKIKQPLQTI
jgi:long-subunit acyl-CoA synthetase (AMP-forming)